MLNNHPQVNGLLWWFPEANEYGLDWATKRVTDNWYNASLFDNETGRALPALYELKNFNDGETGIQAINATADDLNVPFYNLSGQRLANPKKGIYIKKGKKVIVK